MANGPLGGFMPTPAAPAQPPSIKLDTTASSRGSFNNFLKSMNGATSLNPPSMAPSVGATTPTLAPTMSDIDIFNPPVQMMFNGGSVDDFSDFAGFDNPSDPFGGGDTSIDDSNNEQSFVDDDPVAGFDFTPGPGVGGGSFDVVSTPTVTGDEQQQNFLDSEIFVGTPSFPTGRNFGATPNINLSGDVLEDIKKNINIDNLNELSMDDTLFKDNQLTPAGQAELDKMNALTLADVRSGVIPAANFISATSASDVLGDKEKDLGVNLKGSNIDADLKALDRAIAATKGVTDREQQLANVTNQTLADRVQLQRGLDKPFDATTPDTALETLQGGRGQTAGTGGVTVDTIFDPLTYTGPRKDIPNVGMIGGRRDPSLTTVDDIDPREDTLGVLPAQTLADIERLSNVPVGQRKAGPGSDPTFFQGLGLPSFFDGIERFSRDRMASKLATGNVPEDRIVRNDSGRVVALKDQFGRTVEGVDPDELIGGSDDNQEPIIRKPIAPVVEEKPKDDDKPPNVIGGGAPRPVPEPVPTVVASPFAPSSANISPVTFDTGELNKLIELLTGVPARPVVAKQEGGLVSAVDEFLASGS